MGLYKPERLLQPWMSLTRSLQAVSDVSYAGERTMFSKHFVLAIGFPVEEVAHDSNVSLTKKIMERGLVNSYDTWHGKQDIWKPNPACWC